jgi:hypothetical protein
VIDPPARPAQTIAETRRAANTMRRGRSERPAAYESPTVVTRLMAASRGTAEQVEPLA